MPSLREQLRELDALEALLPHLPGARVEVLAQVRCGVERFPIHAICLGPEDRQLPALLFVGGVHGLERVGTQVLLSYLRTLESALGWDTVWKHTLGQMRLLLIPLLNPAGMALGLRSNARGVDLMRNAPVEAEQRSRWFELHRGQCFTPLLPWYRGSGLMEVEAQALHDFVRAELFESVCAISVDVHSGLLEGDRLWFPYARSRRPFPHAAEMLALSRLLSATHEHHVYTIEPQSLHYTTHGDLWDHVYDEHLAAPGRGLLLPLTLELGSRVWYRKNPRQLLSRLGLFHPMQPHRLARVQRRHKTLFDFLVHAVCSSSAWLPRSGSVRATLQREAVMRWYSGAR
jgi:hypothetical protein